MSRHVSRRAVQALAGLAVSFAALWLTLRGKDLGAIWSAVRGADYWYLVPYFAACVAIHFVRTVRWGILLEPFGKMTFGKLNSACAVGFMAVVIMPFRLGELARPVLVAEPLRIPISAALSTVVVERVADGLFTALLLIVGLLAVPGGTPGLPLVRTAGLVMFGAFAALLAFLLVAHRNRAMAIRLAHRCIDPISPTLADRISGLADAFIRGLRLIPNRANIAAFLLLTIVYWAIGGWGVQILAVGFGLHLTLIQAYTVLGVLVVGVSIPAGPAMAGTFQAATVVGLSLFVPRDLVGTSGNAFANVQWAAQLLQQVAFGTLFLFSGHIRLKRVFAAPSKLEQSLEEAGCACKDVSVRGDV